MNNSIGKFIELMLVECNIPTEPIDISQVEDFESQKKLEINASTADGVRNHVFQRWKANEVGIMDKNIPVGLNTIGMLVDRLSIILIKITINRARGIQRPEDIAQALDMEIAIKSVQSGLSSSFNKVTTIQMEATVRHPVEIVLQLTFTNLLLWLAQDVLYLRGAGALPDEELRAYISFFSKKNILRNQLISALETAWWGKYD